MEQESCLKTILQRGPLDSIVADAVEIALSSQILGGAPLLATAELSVWSATIDTLQSDPLVTAAILAEYPQKSNRKPWLPSVINSLRQARISLPPNMEMRLASVLPLFVFDSAEIVAAEIREIGAQRLNNSLAMSNDEETE